MVTAAEHLAAVLDASRPLPPLELGLLDAHGCVLAEDVVAAAPLPGFDHATLDGYAVRAADVATLPVVLPVTGDVQVGSATALSVRPGLAVRVAAGAMLPAGTECLVPGGWTDGGLTAVRVDRAPAPGTYLRRAGEERSVGDTVLAAGSHLGAAQLGLAAAAGRGRLVVRPRPRVVVVSCGGELVEPGEPAGPGRVADANSPALTAAALEAGAIAYRVGIVADDARRLSDTLEDQLIRADLLVLSGAVDGNVREVLARLGPVALTDIASSPALPQVFGTIGPDRVPVFGLPADPVAALVSFELFVRPSLRAMLGASPVERPRVIARSRVVLRSPTGRRSFVRATLEVEDGLYVVTPVAGQGAHLLVGLARANALAMVPEDVEEVAAGESVEVVVLERRGH